MIKNLSYWKKINRNEKIFVMIKRLIIIEKICNDNDNDNDNGNKVVLVFVLYFSFMKKFQGFKTQTKALKVTFIHTIYTNKSTSSNFYPYNIHKQKHFK